MSYDIVMWKILLAISLIAGLFSPSMAQTADQPRLMERSNQITLPPSEAKLVLIRRFMRAAGIQSRLDSGSFLERYALIPEIGWYDALPEESREVNLLDDLFGPVDALMSVYEKYRSEYQKEYESHLNWEFTEDELREMIAFLESPVGQHYLDGIWRMEAYTGTNMEETEEALVAEAVQTFRAR